MHYELNVYRHGHHLFATDPRSLTTEWEARRLLALFTEKFPEADGYGFTLTRQESTSYTIAEVKGGS